MTPYETSATVSGQGEIHLAGVPFTPGTAVEVTVRQIVSEDANGSAENLERPIVGLRQLFASLRGRNTEPVGPLNREELYDRKVLR
jgi:hypothetical protein